jgi:hypothetical protein
MRAMTADNLKNWAWIALACIPCALSCDGLPGSLTDYSPCDCGSATLPGVPVPDGEQVTVLEIYDPEMNLVQYAERVDSLGVQGCQGSPPAIVIDWSGHDRNGNVVPAGKYLAKISTTSACTTMVECQEVFVLEKR